MPGSALTVRYSWKATAPDPGGGGGGGGGGGTGPSGTDPTFKFRVVSKKVLKKGVLDVMASCDRACTVTAYAQLPKAKKRARKRPTTRRKTTALTVPNKTARIRLKLSKKNKRQLKKALRKKKKVALTLRLTVRAATGGPQKAYSKKVVVKRPKKKRARRR